MLECAKPSYPSYWVSVIDLLHALEGNARVLARGDVGLKNGPQHPAGPKRP